MRKARNFYRYVVEGVEPGISARRNLEVMAACQMMVRSVEEKRSVSRMELAEGQRQTPSSLTGFDGSHSK